MIRSFIIRTTHQILFELSVKNDMGQASSTSGGRCIQGFGGET